MKLNIGCGKDYKKGYINIDGNKNHNPDLILDIQQENLLNRFEQNSSDEIYAKDILEHFTHWEAVDLLEKFYSLLKTNGLLTIITPDFQTIIESNNPIHVKLLWIYGGQDYLDNDEGRKNYPQYYCHKFCWIQKDLISELTRIGFRRIVPNINREFNQIIKAIK